MMGTAMCGFSADLSPPSVYRTCAPRCEARDCETLSTACAKVRTKVLSCKGPSRSSKPHQTVPTGLTLNFTCNWSSQQAAGGPEISRSSACVAEAFVCEPVGGRCTKQAEPSLNSLQKGACTPSDER
eukprot:CAMPEP_0183595962 /NCGR_PEP_ID=MMETSP0371-20130417/174310_1 /TAXON_ID=268820 /ORGANISM="Peridinium aciculiferum, Strain PAER-2" /LENGTH=126 /DNA_ID=CAMNT_0025807793 /DNA_START=35 /DNA_END=412 /DNA_ORIENTATION=-